MLIFEIIIKPIARNKYVQQFVYIIAILDFSLCLNGGGWR